MGGFEITIGDLKNGARGAALCPYAFTQEGVAMLSSVLNSPQAIAVNVEIMRAFVRFRTYLVNHQELATKMKELELRFENVSNQQDTKLKMLAEAMRQLRDEVKKILPQSLPKMPKRAIGFHRSEEVEPTTGTPKSQKAAKGKKSA